MSTTNATLYAIDVTSQRDELKMSEIAHVTLKAPCTISTTLEIGGKTILLTYNKATKEATTYEILDAAPWIKLISNTFDLRMAWDVIEPFVIGDQPHLCCYEKERGEFALFPVNEDFSVHYPLYFRHPRHPLTPNLTEVKPRVALGQVFITGYDTVHGFVNNWTVSVTATSDGKHPPLLMEVVWAHQWAKGWTRFAWFTWGGQNYFLKTNTWKPNVNIDHMSSVLSQGSSEVGSHLVLKNAQELDIVHPFMVGAGDPHFLTYMAKTGAVTLNRVHGDCLGWTTTTEIIATEGATLIAPYKIGETNYALFI